MEFGMFHEFPSLPGRTESEAFDEAMEQVDAAERLGLDVMWLAELHAAPARSGPVPLTLTAGRHEPVACPRCGSGLTTQTAAFGATACKALFRCESCREPFEHVKAI